MKESGLNEFVRIAPDVKLGRDVKLASFVNLYGCEIGDGTTIGTFVEIQSNSRVGARCNISSHTCIGEGVTIEDHVFIGHGVTFVDESPPRGTSAAPPTDVDARREATRVKTGALIGSRATILSNVTIGERAIVDPGSVVTRDVPDSAVVAGNPARLLRYVTTERG